MCSLTQFLKGSLIILSLACVAFSLPVARGSNWTAFKGAAIEWFDDDDIRLFMAAVDSVVADEATPAERHWKNEKTGHSGSLRTMSAFVGPNGVRCKRLHIENHAGTRAGKTTLSTCDIPPNGWQLVPSDYAPSPKSKS